MEKNQKNKKNKKVDEDISNKTDEEIIKDLNKELKSRFPHGKPSYLKLTGIDNFDPCTIRELARFVSYKEAIEMSVDEKISLYNAVSFAIQTGDI